MARSGQLSRVVATFGSRHEAESAAAALRSARIGEQVAVESDKDHRTALQGEMREEAAGAVAGPSIGVYTKGMRRGIAKGLLISVPIGVALGIGFALLPFELAPTLVAELIWGALIGAFAAGTIGFLWGGFESRIEGEGAELAAEAGGTVGVSVDNAGAVDRATRILEEHHAWRVDVLEARDLEPRNRVGTQASGEDPGLLRGEHDASRPRDAAGHPRRGGFGEEHEQPGGREPPRRTEG